LQNEEEKSTGLGFGKKPQPKKTRRYSQERGG
jgi:hypothetical protein